MFASLGLAGFSDGDRTTMLFFVLVAATSIGVMMDLIMGKSGLGPAGNGLVLIFSSGVALYFENTILGRHPDLLNGVVMSGAFSTVILLSLSVFKDRLMR